MSSARCPARDRPRRHQSRRYVHVAALRLDIHLPQSRSLKAKRSVVKPILEGMRHRYSVAAAEVAFHDQWQRAGLGVAVVSVSEGHAIQVLDEVERFLWAQPEIEVLSTVRSWLETE